MNTPILRMRRTRQRGVLLIEVLIAILIFALGVLGLVGLQAKAVQQSSQSRYRAEAALLANDLLGQMWLSDRTFATLNGQFSSAGGGAQYTAWSNRVTAALPGATASAPSVTVTAVAPLDGIKDGASAPAASELTPSSQVRIVVYWQAPGERVQHNVQLFNEIK